MEASAFPKIWIIIAVTADYYDKAQPLFDSLKKHAKACYIGIVCIDFKPISTILDFQYRYIRKEEVSTYRMSWPKNRASYVCMEGGDFIRLFTEIKDEDVIIHPDADMVMQRPLSEIEMHTLSCLRNQDIALSCHHYPNETLQGEANKLSPTDKLDKLFGTGWHNEPCMGAACIVANAYAYKRLNRDYTALYNKLTQSFNHHASGQWLVNYIIYANHMRMVDLGGAFHNAEWYHNTRAYTQNGELYCGAEKVLFNHTKFN